MVKDYIGLFFVSLFVGLYMHIHDGLTGIDLAENIVTVWLFSVAIREMFFRKKRKN